MMRCRIPVVFILLGAAALVQPGRSQGRSDLTPRPVDVTISDLTQNPTTFNGRLVRVLGVPALGWEGDNFLRDWPKQKKELQCQLWFYAPGDKDKEIFRQLDRANVRSRAVYFVFTGIFHFVPNEPRGHEVFDPGAYRLEVTSAQPWAVPTSSEHRTK